MQSKKIEEKNYNRDPITGEPGSHPIGTTLGAGAGAVAGATAGASIGAAVGPGGAAIGAVTGAIIGGLGGGAAGGEIAEYVDPTAEEAFWESSYQSRPYVEPGQSYDTYRSAYRYGYDSRARNVDRPFNEVEAELERDWPKERKTSTLEWPQARDAVRDAYDRTGSEYARRIKEDAAASRTGNVIGSASGTAAGVQNTSSSTTAPSNANTPRDTRKTGNA